METLNTKNSIETAECPLRNPLTANPKQCANCIGTHSPVDDSLSKHPWLNGIFRFPLLRAVYECAWGTVYWNRHFVAGNSKPWKAEAPKGEMPFHFRISYFTMAAVISVIVTFLFGVAALKGQNDWNAIEAGLAMLLIAGPGWGIQASIALMAMQNKKWEYLSHLSTVMWLGVMPLLVTSVLVFLFGSFHPNFYFATVGLSSLMMATTHFGRVRKMGISQVWTLSWLVALWVSAGVAIVILFPHFSLLS